MTIQKTFLFNSKKHHTFKRFKIFNFSKNKTALSLYISKSLIFQFKKPKTKYLKMLDSLHIYFKGHLYDVSQWVNKHPGGKKVLQIYNGRDCTEILHATHSAEALKMLLTFPSFPDTRKEQEDLEIKRQAFIKLEEELRSKGVFKPNYFLEFLKLFIVFISLIEGYLGMYYNPNIYSAILLSLSLYYSGWVGHDYSHHNVNKNSTKAGAFFNDHIATLLGGIRGTTILWWKKRHNTHHVSTNEVSNDPDIKLMPILHFFEKFVPNKAQKYQHIYYVPMFFLLHVYWFVESIMICRKNFFNRNYYERKLARQDTTYLIIHCMFSGVLISKAGIFYVLTVYYISGFLTAIVVFATHYGEDRLDPNEAKKMSLVEQTLLTSRNITGFRNTEWDNYIWNWLTGGLNQQIEHHLFPKTPSYNLGMITPYVKELAKKHGLEFRNDNIIECTRKCCEKLHLNVVRNEKKKE